MLVRAFEPSDAEALARMQAEAGVVAGTLRVPFESIAEVQAQLLERAEHERLLVADVGARPVGLAALRSVTRARRSHVAALEMMIDPKADRQVIGAALLDALIGLAERWHGMLRLEVKVWVDDHGALELYRSRGFVIEGVARAYGLRDGRMVDAFYMARVAAEVPWPRVTAEDVSRRTPPQLTAGPKEAASEPEDEGEDDEGSGRRHGNGGPTGWGFGFN